jgi:hypothetical protein
VTDRLPRPLLAALGALTQVRRVPSALLTAPLVAVTALDRARRSYDLLVLRGEQVISDRFGEAEAGDFATSDLATSETATVLDAVSHVSDPLDAPHHPHTDDGQHLRPHQDPDEPLPDFDVMTLGALRGHVRALSVEQLQSLLEYERAHQARPPVLHLVEHRLATLTVS